LFSSQFHLSPAEFWSLTWDEFTAYVDHMKEMTGGG